MTEPDAAARFTDLYAAHHPQVYAYAVTRPGDDSLGLAQDLGAVPVTAADKAAWEADGSPARWTLPKDPPVVIEGVAGGVSVLDARPRPRVMQSHTPDDNFLLGGSPVTLAELSSLPTDPASLRSALLKDRAEQGSVLVDDDRMFLLHCAEQLVFELPVRPLVRAAAYRMLAGLDGVTMLGATTDQHGRKGIAVAYTRRGDSGTLSQTRLIIDPQTGQGLATESWDLGKGASPAVPGKLSHYTLIERAGWTDETPPPAPPSK